MNIDTLKKDEEGPSVYSDLKFGYHKEQTGEANASFNFIRLSTKLDKCFVRGGVTDEFMEKQVSEIHHIFEDEGKADLIGKIIENLESEKQTFQECLNKAVEADNSSDVEKEIYQFKIDSRQKAIEAFNAYYDKTKQSR